MIALAWVHPLSRIGALTLGYLYEVPSSRVGRVGFGADVTAHHVPELLRDDYGSPASFHVFQRYRAGSGTPHDHF